MLYFDIQRFATGTAIKISGVIKNVEVGDTFTVDDAKYTILTVEENSVTAIVEGTPATDFGKKIVISDNKSIEGATIETSETSDVDSEISTKYTYKLDIGGNSVFVTVYENAIESVKDSDGNPLSASGNNYTVGTIDFALSLDNGIPNATYNGTSSVAAVLDTTTYSFSVDSKPVEVVVQNDAITKVSVDSAQVGTAAGTYSVGTQQLKLSYANGSLTAQSASSVSPTISSVATYKVGDTTVTVDSSGQLSQKTATVNGQTATLTYSAETKKITASYTVSTSGNSGTYIVTLPDNSTVTVKIENGAISSVTYDDKEITATDGKYSVTTTGGTNYALSLSYADNNLTATATTTIDELTATSGYTVTFGDDSITITVKDNKLYQGTTELTATNDVYTVTVGSKEVKLTYDNTNGLQEYVVTTNVVDLSTLTADYEAKDGEILTGTLGGNYKISIADGATVTLSGVTINGNGAAGITCLGNATIILEGTNTVTGAAGYAGIQAGGTDTTLTIEGIGSLEATGGSGGAGIGAGQAETGNSTCGDIEIKGGNVTATGGNYGAGIGSGYANGKDVTSTCGKITVSGGSVTATGGSGSAGIGSGYVNSGTSQCGDITISGGTITTNGGTCGAGIGSGFGGTSKCGDITITNDVTKVTATKGEDATNSIGKGGSSSSTGTITIKGDSTTYDNGYNDGAILNDKVKDLSKLTADYEAKDGDILTGNPGSYKISIADGATVTLCDVTINGNGAAGITCLGSATIILEGTNTVTGASNYAGIQAGGENTTLTIEGFGSLSANGGNSGAGIGSSQNGTCGDIGIESGNVTATGGSNGAGIGNGYAEGGTNICGDIEIKGGNVSATGGDFGAGIGSGYNYNGTSKCGKIVIENDNVTAKGSSGGAGIGSGYANNGNSTCGNIEINGGNVTAKGSSNGAGIGSGYTSEGNSTCGTITINGGTVTANGGLNAAGIGSGWASAGGTITCGNITITNDVTKVTATKGAEATNSIGKGYNGSTLGTVTIGGKTGEITEGTYTYEPVADISAANIQMATINGTTITFKTDSTGAIKYTVGNGKETTATITDNTFTFKVGDKDVTATVAGGNVTKLSCETAFDTLKIFTATYTVTLPDKSTVTVKVENGVISSVTYNNKEITATDGKYSVTTTGGTNYTLSLNNGNLTATTTTTIDELISTSGYTVALGDNSITITVKDNKLYQGTTELSATNDIYTVTVGSKEVKLKYDATNGLKEYVVTNVVDLSTLNADYEAKDGDILTGALKESYKISIAAGAKVTLRDVTIDHSGNSEENYKAGIECAGTATITLEGTNSVKGSKDFAGIQAGGTGTTLTITGFGSLTATGGGWGAGIGTGFNSKCGAITISGGTITATGGQYGAGIGSGQANEVPNTCGAITISGGTVTATGGQYGAGIGTGFANNGINKCGDITISGGSVTATGGTNGAGIGSSNASEGATSECGNIEIKDTVTKVTATKGSADANSIGAGKADAGASTTGTVTIGGTQSTSDDKITITGAKTVDLANLKADKVTEGVYTAKAGEILTGTPNSNVKNIYIADGATVTLSNVNITGNGAAGITCLGNATIILEGTNTVKGASNYAGIQAGGENTTLTIEGFGSLSAKGGYGGAGIGSGYANGNDVTSKCGDIEIKGGNVTATGGSNGAGIGNGYAEGGTNICGDIEIKGGNVSATGGDFGAGIGSGYNYNGTSKCGKIVIENDNVTAKGSSGGAGIGSGYANNGNSTCGNIEINGGNVTAKGSSNGAGIGSGYTSEGNSTCGTITINGGTVTANGGLNAAGIGSGWASAGGTITCGNITITNDVTKVTATKGAEATNSIGKGYNGSTLGTVTIGGKTGEITEGTYTYEPVADISAANIQTATINSTTITFKTDSTGAIKYTVGNGKETTATITDNKFTFKVDNTDVTATVADGKVTQLSYETYDPATTTKLEPVTITYEQTATLYTFAVSGNDISVSVDSSGNITYNGQAVTDNKITVDGKEVTLTVSDGKITGASYFGEYSTVTEIEQVDVYKVTIDGQEVSCTFDANNQCTVKVGDKNYLVTKTANDATVKSPAQAVGTEDSRAYLLAVGDGNYLISCTFDGSGNVSAVASDDTALSISGTTIKIGDYTINISGTKDNLITAATLKTTSESVEDVEVKQAFVLSGVKSTNGIIIADNVVTLTEANLNSQDVTIEGDGYTLALDKSYSATTIAPHFDGLTYKSESTSNGYELSDDAKSISCISGTPATDLFTLSGVKSTDGITVSDNVVTLTEANLNNQDVTIAGDGYTLALDKEYPVTTIAPHFDGLTYKSESTSNGYELSDDAKSISYVSGTTATALFTLSGVKSTDGIIVSDNVVTLTEANLNNQDVTIAGDGYTLALDKEYPVTTIAPHFDGLTYKSESTSNGYELSDDAKSISCISGTPATDLFTLSGVKSTDGITVSDNVVTLTEANLNNQDVTIAGDGYTLALDKEYPVTTIAPHFDGLTYKSESTSNGYELSDDAKSISYVSETPATNLFTLTGVKSTDGITVSDNVVTLTEANLNNQDVTIIGDGYTLALDKEYPVTTIAPHFDGLTYKSESTSNGYELSDDAKSISCISGTTATDLFTLTGVKSTDGITVSDNVVTLTEANLNNQDVTIAGDGYTLALDKEYPVTTIAPHFDGLTYKSESTSNGYEISNDAKSISCISGTTATDLFTLTGVKSTDGITVSDNVVTLTEANLNNQDVTIAGDGYTLSLAEGINEPTFNAGGWTLSGTTATYTSASNSEGYTLSDDAKTVTYTSANDEYSSLKVYGVKSTTGLTLSGNVVTVAASSLNKQKVTISEGYTLAIADDVEQPSKKYKQWTQLDKDTYLYTGELTTAGYTLSDNEITYSEEIIAGEQYSIKGAASTELISQGDDTEEVEEISLNRHKVILIETENHNSKNKLKFYGEDYARVTIGAGRDSFITYDGARTDADLTDADNVTIVSFGGEVALKNYDMEKGAVVLVQDVDDIVDAIKTNTVKLVGNEIQIDESSRVAIKESNSKSTIVKLINYDGETQAVGFTGINGGTVNSSSSHENFLLKGNYAENSSDVQKNKPSNLISGNGHDTILAGARDFVDGGNGKNQIFLTPHDLRQTKDGATVVSGGKSRNTVQGFHEGFSYEDDVIQVDNFDNLQFKFDTDGLILNSDDARLKFDGIGTDNATSEDTTNKLGTNKAELIQLTNGSSNIFAAVAKNGQSILVQEDDYQTPTAFFGNRSGLNFSEYDRDVSVNLEEGTGKINKLNATFHGINKLQAGDGMSTLIGDSNRNTLIAGNGYTSLRGGAGNDTLVGKGNSDDKEGWTNFFFMAGDERDVIKDFGFITPDNRDSGTEDKINVEYTDVSNVYVFNDEVIIEFDRDNQLILEDARGKHFYINNLIAKADKNIAYDGITDRYVAGGGSNLTVDPTVDSAEIWLDNSHDTMFLGTPIRTLDASNVKGNTSLVGNEFNNTILAGQGDSKLWGGHSTSNDLLIGGNSRNTFFYCNGNGRDTIAGAHDGDVVILSDVTLEQISETSITADAVAINFKDGGSLQINSRADVTYQLADGSKYFANHEQATWIAKSTTT